MSSSSSGDHRRRGGSRGGSRGDGNGGGGMRGQGSTSNGDRGKHEARVQASSSATPPTDYTPDFFSLEGLAVNNGSVLDTQHTLTPSQAHNHLRPYLFDNFVFRGASHVEGFSRILASVNSRNHAWVRKFVVTSNIY